jgi:hypothetical protein
MSTEFPLVVNTAELANLLAGGDDYIRTKDNVVVGLALKPSLNPNAPEVIVFGVGPNITRRAQLFSRTETPVPVYIKCAVNVWRYAGMYKSIGLSKKSTDIERYRANRPIERIEGILFLERCDTNSPETAGGGFANAKTRKETELAAINFVIGWLNKQKYEVQDLQSKNLGYDLKATKGEHSMLIEVKGTDFPVPRFFISRNEERCSRNEANWKLFVVTTARDKPKLHRYSAKEMLNTFLFENLSWQCTPR